MKIGGWKSRVGGKGLNTLGRRLTKTAGGGCSAHKRADRAPLTGGFNTGNAPDKSFGCVEAFLVDTIHDYNAEGMVLFLRRDTRPHPNKSNTFSARDPKTETGMKQETKK